METAKVSRLKISVVIATYGRAETLRTTLRCLAEQTFDAHAFEVIVVDDESPDDTQLVVAEWKAVAAFDLTYLRHGNRGPGYTQNRGIEVAAAPIVLLIADDIFLTPRALAMHLEAHEVNSTLEVAVLGRVEQDDIPDQSLFLRKWDAFRFSAFDQCTELPYYRFWACNISVKTAFVRAHGCYREHKGRAGYAAHEDVELGFRLGKAGLKIVYCSAALGLHHHLVTFEQACKRRYMQGLNFGEFNALADAPEIPVVYHVLNWRTMPDHVRALSSARRHLLPPEDRNPMLLLLRHALRAAIFNTFLVRFGWEPFLKRAEHDGRLARFVHTAMYRGVIFNHFLRGCRDGDRTYPPARHVPVHKPG